MRTGEIAAAAGVNIQTLRYYERRSLLREPPRTPGGHREYPQETVGLVRFIKRAQELGFSLEQVGELLELRNAPAGNRARARRVAESNLRSIREKVRRLSAMKRALEVLVETCACRVASLECPILEALEDETRRQRPRRGGSD